MTHNIRPELADKALPVGVMQPHPDNPNDGDVESVRESLRTFGQYREIVVHHATGNIIAGNTTYRAALAEGWDMIAAVRADVDEATARRILIGDNRHRDRAQYDDQKLLAQLQWLADNDLLVGTGWEGPTVDDLAAQLQELSLGDDDLGGPLGVSDVDTQAGYLERYQQSAIRSIVIEYPLPVYAWVAERLAAYRRDKGLATNSEAVLAIVAELTQETPPPLEEPA